MRTFLALCCSVGTTRRIAEAMEQKATELAQEGWKLAWVPPAQLHVTLKFFGSIPEESMEAIALRLRQRLAELPAPRLRIRGAGAFPAPGDGPPRVLWLGADGGKPLYALQQTIEGDMADLGFSREARPFHPHLTVARVLEPPPSSAAWQLDQDFGEDAITELIVYESRIGKPNRAGAEYLARARVPFMR